MAKKQKTGDLYLVTFEQWGDVRVLASGISDAVKKARRVTLEKDTAVAVRFVGEVSY